MAGSRKGAYSELRGLPEIWAAPLLRDWVDVVDRVDKVDQVDVVDWVD